MKGVAKSASKLLGATLLVTIAAFTSTEDAGAISPSLQRTEIRALSSPPKPLVLISHSTVQAPAGAAHFDVIPEPWPPGRERLIELVKATWPEDPWTATRVLECESRAGTHADTYSVTAANGGPMQLNRYTWEPFFAANYGWSWEQVVTDVPIHLQAARIIYDRSKGWGPWRCH